MRRENRSGSGFTTMRREEQQAGSRLEEKKKRLNTTNSSPSVSRVENLTDMDKERLRYSVNRITDDDEVPTGILDEDEIDIDEKSEDETPTGFLDTEPEENTMPKLKVKKVTPQSPSSSSGSVKTSSSGMTHSARQRSSGNSQAPKVQRDQSRQASPKLAVDSDTDVPPIRKEDVAQKPPVDTGRKSSAVSKVVVGILCVMALAVAVYAVYTFIGVTGSGVGTEAQTSESNVSEIEEYLNSLYTDDTKSDILDDVSVSNISNALDLLDEYKNSNNYNSDKYDELAGEISTISFFIQDRSIYEDLRNGVYEVGSDDYLANINTLKSDIELYTVPGLAETMNSRVSILETTALPSGTGSTETGSVGETNNTNNVSQPSTQGTVPESQGNAQGQQSESQQQSEPQQPVGGTVQETGSQVPESQATGNTGVLDNSNQTANTGNTQDTGNSSAIDEVLGAVN